MTAERMATVLKLFLPLIAAIVFMLAGLMTENLALVGLGAGGLGMPFMLNGGRNGKST